MHLAASPAGDTDHNRFRPEGQLGYSQGWLAQAQAKAGVPGIRAYQVSFGGRRDCGTQFVLRIALVRASFSVCSA
jgi:hypothetical protein